MNDKFLKGFSVFALIVLLLLIVTSHAGATNFVTYSFNGHFEQVYLNDNFISEFGTPFSIGDSFFGTLTYDLDAVGGPIGFGPPIVGGSGMAYYYYSPPNGISVTINGYSFKSDPDSTDFTVGVINANIGELIYRDALRFFDVSPISPFDFDHSTYISWELFDPTDQALDSDALPTDIDLTDWSQDLSKLEGLFITGINESDGVGKPVSLDLRGVVDQIQVVPEPTTILLLGSGLIGLAAIGRRRLRKS
jgi:hypothetical protein